MVLLRKFCNRSDVTDSIAREVLFMFNFMNIKVPKDPHTIQKRNKENVKPDIIGTGKYVHFSTCDNLNALSKSNHLLTQAEKIIIDLSCDGVPLLRSSRNSLWVISDSIVNSFIPFFIIGVHEGVSKPSNLDLREIDHLKSNGLRLTNMIKQFIVRCIIADAPARQMLTGIKGHASYYGCTNCK